MNRIAFLVFALATFVVADDDKLKAIAERFESDVETVQVCMEEAHTTAEEIEDAMDLSNDAGEETKQKFTRQSTFLACMLEKLELLKDSKLVLDKIYEHMDKKAINVDKDKITECVNTLNEDEALSREDRALGLAICFLNKDS